MLTSWPTLSRPGPDSIRRSARRGGFSQCPNFSALRHTECLIQCATKLTGTAGWACSNPCRVDLERDAYFGVSVPEVPVPDVPVPEAPGVAPPVVPVPLEVPEVPGVVVPVPLPVVPGVGGVVALPVAPEVVSVFVLTVALVPLVELPGLLIVELDGELDEGVVELDGALELVPAPVSLPAPVPVSRLHAAKSAVEAKRTNSFFIALLLCCSSSTPNKQRQAALNSAPFNQGAA
jgi:hypothetical protein